MTDQAALLRAVLDAPADDAPRLVYADWLDERGGPGDRERAEFIRIQVALEPLRGHGHGTENPHKGHCPVCFEVARLEWLERSAFEDNGASWFGPAACLTPPNDREMRAAGTFLIVRRGWVDEIRLTCGAFVGGPCGRCNGDGRAHGADRPFEWSADVDYGKCVVCRGTGRTPGLAAALFAAHPVTEVRLTDKRPFRYLDDPKKFGWGRDRPTYSGPPSEVLPPFLFDLIDPPGNVYEDEDATQAALSRACVTYGRQLAGLPPIDLTPGRVKIPSPAA